LGFCLHLRRGWSRSLSKRDQNPSFPQPLKAWP